MTDPVERINLLEGPARRREIAIQDADAAITDLDTDLVRRAGSPDISEVPLQYLPHRAWARSVDVYDGAWPEAVRRAVIVAAPRVHQVKGTLDAVEKALAALNVDAVITEWWQENPRAKPYTFRVTAFAQARLYEGPLLDGRLIKVVFATILRSKPLSRAFALTVAASLPNTLGLAPAIVMRSSVRRSLCPRPQTALTDGLGLAPVGSPRWCVALTLIPALPPGVTV